MSKIRITTEEDSSYEDDSRRTRGGVSSLMNGMRITTFEVEADTLSQELKAVYTTIADALTELKDVHSKIEIESVQFTLGIDKTGQVSLFSTLTGSSVTKTGITFNLAFRK